MMTMTVIGSFGRKGRNSPVYQWKYERRKEGKRSEEYPRRYNNQNIGKFQRMIIARGMGWILSELQSDETKKEREYDNSLNPGRDNRNFPHGIPCTRQVTEYYSYACPASQRHQCSSSLIPPGNQRPRMRMSG